MNIMKKALFIDRDGTLIKEPADEQIDAFEKLAFVPGVMRNLAFIRQKLDYEFVMVSNQDGLGTDAFPEDTFWPVHNLMMRTLEGEGAVSRKRICPRASRVRPCWDVTLRAVTTWRPVGSSATVRRTRSWP